MKFVFPAGRLMPHVKIWDALIYHCFSWHVLAIACPGENYKRGTFLLWRKVGGQHMLKEGSTVRTFGHAEALRDLVPLGPFPPQIDLEVTKACLVNITPPICEKHCEKSVEM